MQNRVNKLIYLLIAIKEFAKYIHYSSKGNDFFAIHKLTDLVASGVDDFIDQLKEVCLLGANILPDENYLKNASQLIPTNAKDDKENLKKLIQLIKNTLSQIANCCEDADIADCNLLGNIAQDLKQKYALLLRQVM